MIRHAKTEDLKEIMEIYANARKFMAENGNPNQWGDSHPVLELLEGDIEKNELFVCEENGVIEGVFAFIVGDDATYKYIEDGEWLNNKTYGTIHRIASNGKAAGVFAKCSAFCKEQIDNVRIDTHHNNLKMQHVIEKDGYKKCGVIYVEDGSPRIAYHFAK